MNAVRTVLKKMDLAKWTALFTVIYEQVKCSRCLLCLLKYCISAKNFLQTSIFSKNIDFDILFPCSLSSLSFSLTCVLFVRRRTHTSARQKYVTGRVIDR